MSRFFKILNANKPSVFMLSNKHSTLIDDYLVKIHAYHPNLLGLFIFKLKIPFFLLRQFSIVISKTKDGLPFNYHIPILSTHN